MIPVICLFFYGCSKETTDSTTEHNNNSGNDYKSSIKSCECINSKNSPFRLEVTINNEKLCFDREGEPRNTDVWTVTSYDSTISTGRYNKDSTLLLVMQYKNPRFHLGKIPYRIDSSNVEFCEVVNIYLLNLKPYLFCERCPNDDFDYNGLTSSGFLSASVVSFTDSILQGTFSGALTNSGGVKFNVSNGYFNIKINRNIILQ